MQLSLATFGALSTGAQSNQKACRKSPEITSQPKTPQEYREKWKKVSVRGRIAITIDEDGHVSEAKLLEASPKEAADALLATAKTVSFKPRPGCGTFKTEMIFTVNEQRPSSDYSKLRTGEVGSANGNRTRILALKGTKEMRFSLTFIRF
jgi:TonB family protein